MQAKEAGAPVIAHRSFINTVPDFTIVAACVFAVVNAMNPLRKQPAPPLHLPPEPTAQDALLAEIRDLLESCN